MSEKRQPKQAAIIDYGMGNLFSVQRICEHVGFLPILTKDIKTILAADIVILPGVGAFGDAMRNLVILDLIQPLRDVAVSGKPIVGICLGLQLLMSESEEFGKNKGLDIFQGTVAKFPGFHEDGTFRKVPQVGWNRIFAPNETQTKLWERTPLKGVSQGEYVYFVHSYYVIPQDKSVTLSTSNYDGVEYCSSIKKGNIFACQFHPEKSSTVGLQIYKNIFDIMCSNNN